MADRKAVNKYYPPDYDPSKGGLNKAQGTHALRHRARKLDQGILIIRFELPFNIWCGGCERHLAMGVRFNAEKKRVGSYYTTPIWSFRMKCPSCSHWFEIHTDPKNAEYSVVSGARRRAEGPDDQQHQEEQKAKEKERRKNNAFARLEFEEEEKRRKREAMKRIAELQDASDAHWEDPFGKNKRARQLFRQGRIRRVQEAKQDKHIQDRFSLSVPLVPPTEEDDAKAKSITYQGQGLKEEKKSALASSILRSSSSRKANQPKGAVQRLRERLVTNARLKHDPFAQGMMQSSPRRSRRLASRPISEGGKAKIQNSPGEKDVPKKAQGESTGGVVSLAYASDTDED